MGITPQRDSNNKIRHCLRAQLWKALWETESSILGESKPETDPSHKGGKGREDTGGTCGGDDYKSDIVGLTGAGGGPPPLRYSWSSYEATASETSLEPSPIDIPL